MEGAPTRQLSLDARGAASAMTELVVQHASAPAPTRKGPPFRCAMGKAGSLTDKPMSGTGVGTWSAAVPPVPGIETAIGCHTFRATGIPNYPTNGRPYRGRATYGRALERENNGPLRPA